MGTIPVDDRARHCLYQKLEEILGAEEAGTLMNHLPPAGLGDLATKADVQGLRTELQALEQRLTAEFRAQVEQAGRRLVMWMSCMVLATAALAFAAGRFA